MLTVVLVHSDRSVFHILINMYSLFVLGSLLEGLIGRLRFLAVYVLSALGGSVAVLWLAPLSFVVGASGAIFGLLGAFFVIQRRLGGASIQLVVLIAINLAIGFVIPGVVMAGRTSGASWSEASWRSCCCARVAPTSSDRQTLALGAIGAGACPGDRGAIHRLLAPHGGPRRV